MNHVHIDTKTVAIEITDGCLTLGEYTFPDDSIALSSEDTEKVFEALCIARNGLQPADDDEE